MTSSATPPPGAAVSLIACAKTFPDGTKALTPVSLDIAPGETVVLLGPSGCGKTTLLRILAGLEAPDPGGRVLIDGDDVTALPIEKRNVGMVFQSYALFPNMNVLENVAYGLRVRGTPRAERELKAGAVLEMMRIGQLAGRRIDQLSGGQRQRVALARALAVRPRVLLLDEPMTALDAALREHLRIEIDALLRQLAITAVYVTHDQAEALALADRVVVMRQGAIAQIGTPREVYLFPADPYVAGFVGVTNLLPGTVRARRFESAAGTLLLDHPDQEDARLAFRPEDAVVGEAGSGLVLTVAQVFFQGARQKVVLEAPDGVRVTVEAPAALPLAAGQRVGLALDPSRISVM